jgi:SAM-dependent methyltransferase
VEGRGDRAQSAGPAAPACAPALIYEYRGCLYPEYLKHGGASRLIEPVALHFCRGDGLDVGCGQWALPGAVGIDLKNGTDALNLPGGPFDFIFSSHCLEHLTNPVQALEHWAGRLRPGGVLFLYLPHPDMEYWLPQNCRKHLHQWWPEDMEDLVRDLGFVDVIRSDRDLAWSFAVVGFKRG